MTTISKDDLQQLAQDIRERAGGTIFSICFKKRSNGEIRTMHARFGVTKGLKDNGQGRAYDPKDYDLLTVYDVAHGGYRSIPLDNILWVRIRGKCLKRKQSV
jgi:hypothetical protein